MVVNTLLRREPHPTGGTALAWSGRKSLVAMTTLCYDVDTTDSNSSLLVNIFKK